MWNMYKIKKRRVTLEDFLKLKKYQPFSSMRQNGKTINLATIFACSGPTLGRQMKQAGFTEEDCDATIATFGLENAYNQTLLNNTANKDPVDLKYMVVGIKLRELFFQTYPGLLERVEREQRFAMKHGYVRTWSGPIRHLPELRYMKFNAQGNLVGMDKKLYSRMFAGMKNEASNTSIQTAEVQQAMPDATALQATFKEWGLKTRIFNYVHDSFVLYVHKSEKDLVYALLNKVAMEHREPYYGLRMYIDVVESDLNKGHYYDNGKEIDITTYDLDYQMKKWNEEHEASISYTRKIPGDPAKSKKVQKAGIN